MPTETATPTAKIIDAMIFAGSVAASAGGFAGMGLAGAGGSATNQVVADVHAYIDGTDPGSDGVGSLGILANSVLVSADDTNTSIHATVGTAAVGVGVGAVGAAISVGISLAHNQIDNDIAAYIANAGTHGQTVATRSGGAITVQASEGAGLHALGVAASVAASPLPGARRVPPPGRP